MVSSLAFALALLGSNPTSAATPARPPTLNVSGDKLDRAVDCHGADINVASNDSTLKLTHCNGVVVAGSGDHVSATLLETSDILVLGDHDVIRWTPFPGASPVVTDRGKRNTTAPF